MADKMGGKADNKSAKGLLRFRAVNETPINAMG